MRSRSEAWTLRSLQAIWPTVHTGLEDPQEFFAIDIWSDPVAMGEFYANPDVAAGFASLFEDEPSVSVYQSTDWLQW